MSDRVRVGVVGTGWWATQFHMPALIENPHADLVAVAESDPERLRAVRGRFDIAYRYDEADALFDSGVVEAVVIATPHSTHYRLVKAALESDIHVLCEKPFVLEPADAHELVEMAVARGLHLVVGYTYQFTSHAEAAKRMVREGRIGDLLLISGLFASMVEAYYRGAPEEYRDVFDFPLTGPAERTYSDPALSGGGQARTQITHAANMALWVTGARPVDVQAFMENHSLPVDLVDALSFRLGGGAVGTVASTGSLKPGQEQQQELRYYGSEGFILQELIHGELSFHGNDGSVETLPPLSEDEVYPAGKPSACLVDLVRGAGENRADAVTAAQTVGLLDAAYRSAVSGQVEAVWAPARELG